MPSSNNHGDHPVLSKARQETVVNATHGWVKKASDLYSITIDPIDVFFDLRGRTSGMFCTRGKRRWIRYNPWIFAKHFDDSLAITVPHEVAHYVCFLLHERKHWFNGKQKLKPHGVEWKAVMQQFGVPANATCTLDISDVPQKQLKRFPYKCLCSTHELTSIRHNRIVRGRNRYLCPKCNSELKRAI